MFHFSFKYILYILFIFSLFITIFFFPFIENTENFPNFEITENLEFYDSGFIWPSPGYTHINSYFGKRESPTPGASTFHKGIDIGAPEGAKLVAIIDGTITFANFLGGGGYTITLSHDDLKITYCHVDPLFLVSVGDNVLQGQVIGFVGPKYVYNVPNNQYLDSLGNPTNGVTTGPHLHLGIRKNDKYINPLSFFMKPIEKEEETS